MKRSATSQSTTGINKKNVNTPKRSRGKSEVRSVELMDCPAKNLRFSKKRDEEKVWYLYFVKVFPLLSRLFNLI